MTKKQKLEFKNTLYQFALKQIEDRIAFAEQAMLSAQDAANDEGKSSAGDKYETARAMGQIDSEMNARQFEEANRDLNHLLKMDVNHFHETVIDATVVITSEHTFFISVGLGIQKINKSTIVFISLSSPMGKVLADKKEGDKLTFNNKEYLLKEVF